MIAKRRIGLTRAGEVCCAYSGQANSLLVCEGGTLEDERARDLGLLGDPQWDADAPLPETAPEVKAAEPVEDKAQAAPKRRKG